MKVSKSLISGKKYQIPSILDDKKNIDSFIDQNNEKPIIVVQGLGFVGAVMSLVCANAINGDYAVIGIDLPTKDSYWKIASINDGIFPVTSSDKKVGHFFDNAKEKNNFIATYDSYAYAKADYIIVDINLDVQKNSTEMHDLINYDVNMSGFKKAIKDIGMNCKEDVLILIETTVPPGTTKIASAIIKSELQNRGLNDSKFKIGHSYERVMPGPNYIDSIQNFYRVYSGIDEKSADAVEVFLKTIISTDEYPLTRLINTNATEVSKVLENSYRAMNIAFIVEWSRFAEEAGVDLYEIVDAIRMRPTHKNIMLPGIGVGGYCLTKDPLLASWSKQNIINGVDNLRMSEMAVSINDKMPEYAFNFLDSFFDKGIENMKVCLLGVSYLPDVGDTRYSPVELLYKCLKKKSCSIKLHDPFISYWDELNLNVENNINLLNEDFDIIIFSTGHTEYKSNKYIIKEIMSKKKTFILDTIGILKKDEIDLLSTKHNVKILGRGDLK